MMKKLQAVRLAPPVAVVFVAITAALGTGCAARVYSEPAYVGPPPVVATTPYDNGEVVYDDQVPVDIEMYPSFYYGGGYAYYVDGRWYRRDSRGWGYYRREPQELSRHRDEAERERQRRGQQGPRADDRGQRGGAEQGQQGQQGQQWQGGPRPGNFQQQPLPVPPRRGVTEPQPAPPRALPRVQLRRPEPPPPPPPPPPAVRR